MPEGDTIFRTATSLRRWLTGRTVTGARSVVPGIDCRRLVGREVTGVDAQGKHLLIRLSGGLVVHSHMRMSGSWHVYPTGEPWRRPARQARLVLEAGSRTAVCFNAPVIEVLTDHEERAHPSLRRLGPDVLVPASLDPDVVHRRARARVGASPTIGELLLDQQVVAGIGNIYRCETLFLEGLHPWTPSADVGDATLDRLVATAARLMSANARTGNPIARDFDGGPDQPWVYRRGGLACRRCGTTVERGVLGRQARSVYWCPTCQPAGAVG
jgi:endonuclease-8